MYPLNQIIKNIGNMSAVILLRNAFGIRPKYYKEPPLNYSVSDLFLWRSDDFWRTRFDLVNLPSILYPDEKISDSITLIFYNQKGEEFHREKIIVSCLQKRSILIEDIIGKTQGFGTMACFHETQESLKSPQSQTCIVERGFIAYQRIKDDCPLWSFVHGSAYILAKAPGKELTQTTRRGFRKKITYRPQVLLGDCNQFELIYINPNDKDLLVQIRLLNKDSNLIRETSEVLHSRGVKVIKFDNNFRTIHRVENESRAYMLRPYILKYYKTHFDIFHS